MSNKKARTIAEHIELLQSRNMLFRNLPKAPEQLSRISYYRLKGYWWDMQADRETHFLNPNSYFEDVIERYYFDKKLRTILFDAIELIEISLRTKMINFLSLSYGGLWYLDSSIFKSEQIFNKSKETLETEFKRSGEIFIKNQKKKYPNENPDAWKILEVASFGTLSRIYKNLNNQLPEKSSIAKGMGLNISNELSSWLEALSYIRNIIAHHSRLWSRNMVKTPTLKLNNPKGKWLSHELTPVQEKKPFLIITSMIYLCDAVDNSNTIKEDIKALFKQYPDVPIYKLGFLNNWDKHAVWQ